MQNISNIKHPRMDDLLEIISGPRPQVLIYSLARLYISRLCL